MAKANKNFLNKSISDIRLFIEWLKGIAVSEPEVEKIILYGSFARGDAFETSDIDLAFFLSDLSQWARLADMIRENARTLRGLDLVCFQDASNALKERIQKEGVVIFERRKD